MVQDIATLLAVSGAVIYSIIAVYRQIRKALSPEAAKCSDCTACRG